VNPIFEPLARALYGAKTDNEEYPSLTDALRQHGYAHEPSAKALANVTDAHRIYRIDTGETVGEFNTADAWDFLKRTHGV
jgi:hypothetical protein